MAVLKDRIEAFNFGAVLVGLLMAAIVGMPVWPLLRAQAPPPPNGAFVSTGSPVIEVGGIPVAAEPNLNFASSQGIVQIASDNPAMSRVDITPALNSVYVPTFNQLHANVNFCDSVNGTTIYSCDLPSAPLIGYARGNSFLLAVDTTCAATCTVNISTLGPVAIYQSDGMTAPNGSLIAGQAKWIWYDGKVFRLV
jgi:hypothetical protein